MIYNTYMLRTIVLITAGCLSACGSINTVTEIPHDIYTIPSGKHVVLDTSLKVSLSGKRLKVDVEQSDSVLYITPITKKKPPFTLPLHDIKRLSLYRYTFDIDVLTVPFKVRPAVGNFPEQLNANFSAALYLGRRRDSYSIKTDGAKNSKRLSISGTGYGYGGFIGIGGVTMNPFVTNQMIDYEYDGFVLSGGLAGIYDAKKFNLGLALGADYLVDKNRNKWIYQGKPWLGILFGINLN